VCVAASRIIRFRGLKPPVLRPSHRHTHTHTHTHGDRHRHNHRHRHRHATTTARARTHTHTHTHMQTTHTHTHTHTHHTQQRGNQSHFTGGTLTKQAMDKKIKRASCTLLPTCVTDSILSAKKKRTTKKPLVLCGSLVPQGLQVFILYVLLRGYYLCTHTARAHTHTRAPGHSIWLRCYVLHFTTLLHFTT
jgi:hypothetical protein